jgi:hypothetical protein
VALAVFWLQTALKNEKSGAARADSTRPSWAECGVFSLTGLGAASGWFCVMPSGILLCVAAY